MNHSPETTTMDENEKPYIRLRQDGPDVRFDGNAVCQLGSKVGISRQEQEQGIFAEWRWDGEKLIVRNDRYGFYPLFYAQDAAGISVSPSLLKLLELGASTRLNAEGLSVFLRIGWFIGDHTPFEAIRAFPPNSLLEWSNGVSRITTTQSPPAQATAIDYNEAMERYEALFRAAIHRCAPPTGNFVVPLSGGKDSRHILLELLEAGYRPDACITQRKYPVGTSENDEDVTVAGQLCQTLGIRHVVVDQYPSRLSAEIRKNRMTELCALEHGWGMPFTDEINAHWDYAYDGIGGDVLTGGVQMSEKKQLQIENGDYHGIAADMLDESDGYLSHLLHKQQFRRFSRELAMQALVAEISRYTQTPNPIGSFYFANRTRRTIALGTYTTWARKSKILTPYLDHDLYDFMCSLPGRFLMDTMFKANVIRKSFPQYSHIPFDTKRTYPALNTRYQRRFALESAAYTLRRPWGPLLRRSGYLPRAFRSVIDRGYSDEILGFGPLAVYLRQLEEYV